MSKKCATDFCGSLKNWHDGVRDAYRNILDGNCLTVSRSVNADLSLYRKYERADPIFVFKLNQKKTELPVLKLLMIIAISMLAAGAVCMLTRAIFKIKYRKRW